MITPREIDAHLRQTVVGQDDAIREIAVSLVKHLVGHSAGNVLLIGNSGSGKTTLMRAVESLLLQREDLASYSTVIRINATVLAEEQEGYGKTVLERLHRASIDRGVRDPAELVRRIERGIVFLDEIDKIRANVGGVPNPRGIVAQEALLTLMENENVELSVRGVSSPMSIDSSSILFIAGGAFEELYDSVLRKAMLGAESAPLKPIVRVSQDGTLREELDFRLGAHLRLEDLFRYGMTPQFVSRFESTVILNDLGETELARIFIEPEGSIFRVSREYFRSFGIDLQITRGAIRAIAWEASRKKRIGARALREVYRRIIRNLEFDPRGAAEAREGVILIDEDQVRRSISAESAS